MLQLQIYMQSLRNLQVRAPQPVNIYIHRRYSRGQKSKVACYERHHGIRKAARHYDIHHRNVQRWVKDQVTAPVAKPTKRVKAEKLCTHKSWKKICSHGEEEIVAVSTQVKH